MRRSLMLSLLIIAPAISLAQAVTNQNVSPPEVVEADKNISKNQQVYVVQNAQPTQSAQQAQAIQAVRPNQVTVVEDTPLKESKADSMRRSRLEVENQTEQRVVEKIESERLKAEQERAEKISKALESQNEPAPAPVYAQPAPMQPVQQAPVYVQPAPVVAVAEPHEMSTEVDKEDFKKDAPKEAKEKSKVFVSALGGIADYPSITNVKGIYSAGVSGGMLFPDRLIVELSLLFSSFDVQEITPYSNPYFPVIKRLDQMDIDGGVKYQILDGRIRPTVGALLGYTHRTYSPSQSYYYSGPSVSSTAFDAGFSGGADVMLSENFSVGIDIRYMFNLSYRIDGPNQASIVNPNQFGNPIESLDYYIFTAGARLTF